MKHQLRKFHFTLVEVLIAMGICIVGVVSVMGLFPVGANAARDASMAFYADQAAEQMLNFTRYAVLSAQTKVVDSSVPEGYYYVFSPVIFKHMTSGTMVGGGECTGWDLGDLDHPDSLNDTSSYQKIAKPAASAEPDDWSEVENLEDDTEIHDNLIGEEVSANMITMLTNNGTVIKKHSWNLYRIGFITKNGVEEIEDFACVVRLWATPVYLPKDSTEADTILPRIATFHAEVSWPADIAYDRRQKVEYTLDVFVPEG